MNLVDRYILKNRYSYGLYGGSTSNIPHKQEVIDRMYSLGYSYNDLFSFPKLHTSSNGHPTGVSNSGDIWFNTSTNTCYIHSNGAWMEIGGVGKL